MNRRGFTSFGLGAGMNFVGVSGCLASAFMASSVPSSASVMLAVAFFWLYFTA